MLLGLYRYLAGTTNVNPIAAVLDTPVGSRGGEGWVPNQSTPLESRVVWEVAAAATPFLAASFAAMGAFAMLDEGVGSSEDVVNLLPCAFPPQSADSDDEVEDTDIVAFNAMEVATLLFGAIIAAAFNGDDRGYLDGGPCRLLDLPAPEVDFPVELTPAQELEKLEDVIGARPIFVYETYREHRPKRGTRGRGRVFLGRKEIEWSDMHTDCLLSYRDPLARASQSAWRSQLQRHLVSKYSRDSLQIWFVGGERSTLRPGDAINWKAVLSLALTSEGCSLAREALADTVDSRQENWRELWEQYHSETANVTHMGSSWRVWLWWRQFLVKFGLPAPLPPRQ